VGLRSALCGCGLSLVLLLVVAQGAAASSASYGDADYFRFADRIVRRLEATWSPADGYYRSGAPALDSRFNAALLTVYATAAAYGHVGPARNDERARALARRLTASPPFFTGQAPTWPDTMFHTPGWVGNMVGGYSLMDKAIDPKIAEGLEAAWEARDVIGLPMETERLIQDEITRVAHGSFFRFPNVRFNQINWPLELAAYDAVVTAQPYLLRNEYRLQVRRFVRGIRRPWVEPLSGTSTNLSPSYRFHYAPKLPPYSPTNLDSAEYANTTLHFLTFYEQARRAGMPALPRRDVVLLRAWVQRDLFGYWTHAGALNWDTGLGFRRWMKGKTWAYGQQGLLAIAGAKTFQSDRRYGAWAKTLFDRGLELYDRALSARGRLGELPPSDLYGIRKTVKQNKEDRMFAARMAANAVRAVSSGLGRIAGHEPPPFYSFDADVGRLAVSTPSYSTAIVAVNRGAFPYGGIELARLFDRQGDPISGIGGHPPAAFGVVVHDRAGHVMLESQRGLRRDPIRPPVALTRSHQGKVDRLVHLPARPAAGPFHVLEAVASRRSRDLGVTTRHRFTARAIDERWSVRRRAGRQFYAVAVLLPSWGRAASIDAELDDGTIASLAADGQRTGEVPLAKVRRFDVRSAAGSYAAVPVGTRRGLARTILVAPQASDPDPGPTLELTLNRGTAFKRASLRVRIEPSRGD
jgi:hypothetical protein